jgi:GrpB-like predicted nucleotidyltransferase (UPF0157 family)
MPVTLTDYDPRWPARFAAESRRVSSVLAPWLAGPIEHIGSTAVPGQSGKQTIDMVAPVRTLGTAEQATEPLRRLGYRSARHREDAVFFFAPADAGPAGYHDFHLHLTESASALWCERIAFRDALRADPELVRRYALLKRQLLEDSAGSGYGAAGKRAFVTDVLARAGIRLEPR